MSVQTIQSSIERIQREIQSLQRQLTEETRKEASKTERTVHVSQSITRSTSASMLQSKQREIQQVEREIVSIQKRRADLTKRIADKTADMHRYQQQLFREQDREQKKVLESFQRRDKEARQRHEQLLQQVGRTATMSGNGTGLLSTPTVAHDAFISHASEDKEDLARPLAEKLREGGFDIWYDEFQLSVGDSLRRSIDRGLANSRFGIVVLSPAFFAKNWPQYELDGLVAREMNGGKIILPLWYKVSKDEVLAYSPSLADKVALKTAVYTVEEIAQQLGEVLRRT